MSDENKKINDNHYLIGSRPETIKADIMNFKEEVLVDFKELSKNLKQKYNKINNEFKENMELFNNKISDINLKLLELNSKIVTDSVTREKLSQLLNFKEKAEKKMETNSIKIRMMNDEAYNKINEINNLLSCSFLFPGLIGPQCKYKNFREFIEYIFAQVNSLNSFKEKNLIEFGLYKTKTEYLFNTLKIKIDTAQKEVKYDCMENIRKNEEKILEEISLRDEKFKDISFENQGYAYKLDKQINNLKTEINIINVMREEMNKKIKEIEAKSGEEYASILDRYNNIENKIFNMQNNLQNAFSYLNRQGANLTIIKDQENISPNIFDTQNKNQSFQNLNTERSIRNNIYKYGNNETSGEYGTKEPLTKRTKSSKERKSDIAKYVHGEITADEIGFSTNKRRKIMKTIRNQFEEHLIDKQEYQKSSFSYKPKNEIKKEKNIIKKINNKEESFNDNLYVNYTNSVENTKELKTEKRIGKSFSAFKKLMMTGFQDLDAKFQYERLPDNYDNKSSRNNNSNNIFNKFNKDNFFYKNININQPKSTQDIQKKLNIKNISIIPGKKMVTLKNLEKELTAINFFNRDKNNPNVKLLSPIIQKIDKNKINLESNNNLMRLDNNNNHRLSKLSLAKIKKKILNFDSDSKSHNNVEYNSNNTFNSNRIEYTK